MRFGIILPHLKVYGGIRRYIEMSNALVNKGHSVGLFIVDYDPRWQDAWGGYDIDPRIFIAKETSIPYDICICGDASSLDYLEAANAQAKVVNVIFPYWSEYEIGNYGKLIHSEWVVGNGTGWKADDVQIGYTIPGAVNPEMFKPTLPKSERYSVLFVDGDRPWKGTDTIEEAIKQLNASFTFGYIGKQNNPVFDKLGCTAHINIPQNKLADIYSQYHTFISAEQLAGWQNCVAEAMSCGCAVVTTSIGTRDFAIDGETALIAENVDELIDYILFLEFDKVLYNSLITNGMELISNFNWNRYANDWISFAEMVLNKERQKVADKATEIKNVASTIPIEANYLQHRINEVEEIRTKSFHKPISKYVTRGAYHWDEDDQPYIEYVSLLRSIAKDILKPTGKLIDIGGGDGYISYKMSEFCPVVLTDVDGLALELGRIKINQQEPKYGVDVIHKSIIDIYETYPYILLSQVIEHFAYPKVIVNKLRSLEPDVLIVGTPLAKPGGAFWDRENHEVEFSRGELIDLFKEWSSKYILSYYALEPYNQIVVLEKRSVAFARYVTTNGTKDEKELKDLFDKYCELDIMEYV